MSLPTPIIRYSLDTLDRLGQNLEASSYNATASNITIVSDATFGNVAYFSGDGTSSINMDTVPTYALVGNAPRTISFWFTLDTLASSGTSTNHNLYSQGNLASGQGNFAQIKIGSSGTDVRIEYGGTSNQKYEHALETDTWYSFVGTYDGTISKTYLNGALVLTHTVTLNTEAGFVNLGTTFSNGIDFAGKMVDFRIYDSDLSLTEISTSHDEGPSPEVLVSATMYSNLAQISWSTVLGASSYTLTASENSGAAEVVAESIAGNDTIVYNLNGNSTYDFVLYTDLDPVESVGSSLVNTTPVVDGSGVSDMVTFVSNDLTAFNSDIVALIHPYLGEAFSTGEVVTTRVLSGGVYNDRTATFVDDGDTMLIAPSYLPVLTPFVQNASSGQTIHLQLSDLSTQTITYDETSGVITIDGETYSVGDRFILDGKSCKVASLF